MRFCRVFDSLAPAPSPIRDSRLSLASPRLYSRKCQSFDKLASHTDALQFVFRRVVASCSPQSAGSAVRNPNYQDGLNRNFVRPRFALAFALRRLF